MAGAKTEPKSLTTKKIKRQIGKIGTATEKKQKKQASKLATAILRQIADGKIKDPVASAKAFFKTNPEAAAEAAAEDMGDEEE